MRHGELGTYMNHGCRCAACRSARREYSAARREGREWTGSTMTDVAPVREHLEAMRAAGWMVVEIAVESGVPTVTIHAILRRSRRTRRETAAALLALPVDPAVAVVA